MFQINQYQPPSNIDNARVIMQIMMNAILMFMAVYFIRATLTKFFVMQTEAERTNQALTQVLDNLPDAVLMMDNGKLSYCN
jgi:hypothetical protein